MRLNPLPVVVSLAVLVSALAAPAQGAAADREPAGASTPAAAAALADAEALFAPAASTFARGRETTVAKTRDATLVLRTLRGELSGLSAADRPAAERLLSRPASDSVRDFGSVRVHWSSSDDDVKPAYVTRVGTTADQVLASYVAAGYRAPEPDAGRGGSDVLDIYLEDLGSQGLYGYCDSDDPPPDRGPYDTSAYCAFDNDYQEFPAHTPLENLQVTAAHELFHAVQFAYDYNEDGWFMEATATWAEDELYDDVNDNLQYLSQSPLGQPAKSMDRFHGLRQYGDWIFFRFLSERYPDAAGALPTIVRDLWERADGSATGADDYSIRAVAQELASRGSSLRAVFAGFASANRRPAATYAEGRRYPVAPLVARTTLTRSHPGSGVLTDRIDHLTSATYRFTRGSAARRLRVRVDLPPTYRGSSAVLTVHGTGKPRVLTLALSHQGDATKKVDFGSEVTYVEVTLVNASARYACGERPLGGFSCSGRALDDDLRVQVRAKALR